MWSAGLDEYQHAVGWHYDLFLFRGNGWVLVLAQGFFDLLFDLQQGSIQCGCLGSDFWEVGNVGSVAVCRECAKHRIRLVLHRDTVLHLEKVQIFRKISKHIIQTGSRNFCNRPQNF